MASVGEECIRERVWSGNASQLSGKKISAEEGSRTEVSECSLRCGGWRRRQSARGLDQLILAGVKGGGVLIKGRDQTRGPTCWITEWVICLGIVSVWKVRPSRMPR